MHIFVLESMVVSLVVMITKVEAFIVSMVLFVSPACVVHDWLTVMVLNTFMRVVM